LDKSSLEEPSSSVVDDIARAARCGSARRAGACGACDPAFASWLLNSCHAKG